MALSAGVFARLGARWGHAPRGHNAGAMAAVDFLASRPRSSCGSRRGACRVQEPPWFMGSLSEADCKT
eukprot:12283950-Alexandrium_andersonii.AAC.1